MWRSSGPANSGSPDRIRGADPLLSASWSQSKPDVEGCIARGCGELRLLHATEKGQEHRKDPKLWSLTVNDGKCRIPCFAWSGHINSADEVFRICASVGSIPATSTNYRALTRDLALIEGARDTKKTQQLCWRSLRPWNAESERSLES